jgi:hypothetical protein
VGPPGTTFGEKITTGRPYWDLGVLGGSAQFAPLSTVLSALSGTGTGGVDYNNNGNSSTAPLFLASYFNTDRRHAYQIGETTGEATLISTPAALDEGGNFIRPQFGPLSLENPTSNPPNQPFGNYHVTAGVGGANLATGPDALYSGAANVPNALATDFDGEGRPTSAPHRGADQVSLAAPPTLASIAPATGVQGATNLAVSLTGTNLSGATAVNVSGTGVTCAVTGSTATTVAANCSITAGATTGARTVSVTTPNGTSGTVTFTVTAPPPGTVSFTSASFGTLSTLLGARTLSFGNINSTTVTSTVTLTVGGGTAVTFGTATVSDGLGQGTFSKGVGDTCSGTTRAVGATCTIPVTLAMPGGGNTVSLGNLSVPHNGSGNPATLVLAGN